VGFVRQPRVGAAQLGVQAGRVRGEPFGVHLVTDLTASTSARLMQRSNTIPAHLEPCPQTLGGGRLSGYRSRVFSTARKEGVQLT
jgi:hypothetical protein